MHRTALASISFVTSLFVSTNIAAAIDVQESTLSQTPGAAALDTFPNTCACKTGAGHVDSICALTETSCTTAATNCACLPDSTAQIMASKTLVTSPTILLSTAYLSQLARGVPKSAVVIRDPATMAAAGWKEK